MSIPPQTLNIPTKQMLAFLSLLAVATAQQVSMPSQPYYEHTYEELKEMGLLQRLVTYNWKLELVTVSFTLFYLLTHFLGASYNARLVSKWVSSAEEVLDKQFASLGCSVKENVVKDDNEHYTYFATGRKNIESLTVRFTLKPRHNLLLLVSETILAFFITSIEQSVDSVNITVKYSSDAESNVDDFIWAIVNKDGMNQARIENYFLSLTKTSESSKLPTEYVFMSETADITEEVYNESENSGLTSSPTLLKYVAFTDQSIVKPTTLEEAASSKKAILYTSFPTTASELKANQDLLTSFLSLVDNVVENVKFRPETLKRVKKTREAETQKIKKALEEVQKEELENKRVEEQRKERERIAKLSPEEQRKIEKKRQEKKQRKQMKQQRVR
ncbi:BA75_00495T0 [Komagataella pastoris]|uniref:BA75_00495T0 n=1 Tax=Komagataella pastoris TaxID=4922 RepID=A0A1B2J7A8_PICPA|nr:BA75_00495T0 [Komagataella pastoris]